MIGLETLTHAEIPLLRALVFEDNLVAIMKINGMLSRIGMTVLTATNLPDSLALVNLHIKEPLPCQVILFDSNLHSKTDRMGSCGKAIHSAALPLRARGTKFVNISDSNSISLGLEFDSDPGKDARAIEKSIRELFPYLRSTTL